VTGKDDPPRPASWATAVSEAEAAARHAALGEKAARRLGEELRRLRDLGAQQARLDVARRLAEGPDGGALGILTALAEDTATSPDAQRQARAIVERLFVVLGLAAVGTRGEYLRLAPDQLSAFEVRGSLPKAGDTGSADYLVVRPGLWLDDIEVTRPLLEPVQADADD
jgi:hypothetical protein